MLTGMTETRGKFFCCKNQRENCCRDFLAKMRGDNSLVEELALGGIMNAFPPVRRKGEVSGHTCKEIVVEGACERSILITSGFFSEMGI